MKGKVRIWHIIVLCIGLALIGVGLALLFYQYPIGAELSRAEMRAIAFEAYTVKHAALIQSVDYIGNGVWEVSVATGKGIFYYTFAERTGGWFYQGSYRTRR